MTKKPPTPSPKQPMSPTPRSSTMPMIDPYKKLLARVAGSVAVGLIQNPSPALKVPSDYAEVSVEIAREILRSSGVEDPVSAA